ncbi:MAG: MBL fold metallo-hydrolase [Archaeoglobaceae archaeon]|nr:MBL fold metallo-hydrolase [Archaeoglobaceae archaeon]MCX8152788.1 MBL fold metallo-hydrolase [Archaeoglobaceae archaeon]MDW8013495.1 MBL fold metallo-hydrolase [Archaeoglobaceae archaeon]
MPVERLSFEKVEKVNVYKCGTLVGNFVPYWVYFYKYEDFLFDCGCPNVAFEIENAVGDVSAVYVTHYHEDHVGAAHLFRKVYAPEKSLKILRNPLEIPGYRKIVWGQPKALDPIPVKEKDVVNGVKVVETPGHSFDHVCYLVDDLVFSGDLVINTRQMVVMREENCLQIIESLKKVLKFDFSYAFGGIGPCSREDVEKYLEYLENLRDKVNELHSAGKSLEEIVEIVFPNPPQKVVLMELISEREWSRENMVKSLIIQ